LVWKIFLLVVLLAAPNFVRAQVGGLPGPTPPPPPPPPQLKDQTHGGIRVSTDLVLLHVTVMDEHGQFVPGLKQNNFRVFEDKVEQKISAFLGEDVPVTMGLVIDNSGSMREKRAQVNAAALTFIKTSNPQDEVFVVNFNDEYYLDLDKDFTNDQRELNEALSRIDARGSTALFDAVIGSLDHLRKGHKDKKVLLVITDGDDDASRKKLADVVAVAQKSDAQIYAIGVFSDEDRKSAKKMIRNSKKELTEMTVVSGGAAYFPDTLEQVQSICAQVAHDIRNQYTLGYYPTNLAMDGSFRQVQVQLIQPKDRGKMTARTRAGYYSQKTSHGD
jgi:Ca-activated chloride channel family protein